MILEPLDHAPIDLDALSQAICRSFALPSSKPVSESLAMPTLKLTNGPNTYAPSLHELTALVQHAPAQWDAAELFLEVGARQASIRWADPDREGAISSGLLFTLEGESPLGEESPELRKAVSCSGGLDPIASRFLLDAQRMQQVVLYFAAHGERLLVWDDGTQVRWEPSVLDLSSWRAVGELEDLDATLLYTDDLATLVYGGVAAALEESGDDADEEDVASDDALPDGERAWVGQVGLRLSLDDEPCDDEVLNALHRNAIWPVLRSLQVVTDARWLSLLAARPMTWLRSLMVETDELDALGDVVASSPNLVELAIHARPSRVPALRSATLRTLILDLADGASVEAVMRAAELPALRVLILFGDSLTSTVSLPTLDPRIVVLVELGADDAPTCLANVVTRARVVRTVS